MPRPWKPSSIRRSSKSSASGGSWRRCPATKCGWSTAPTSRRADALLRRRDPLQTQLAQLGRGRISGRGVAAREPVVALPRALELLRRQRHACRRSLAGERLEELLGQHVGLAADPLARVERAHEMEPALADRQQLVERGIPSRARADELDGLGWTVELPRRPPDELAEAQGVEGGVEALCPVREADLVVGQVTEIEVAEVSELGEPATVDASRFGLQHGGVLGRLMVGPEGVHGVDEAER